MELASLVLGILLAAQSNAAPSASFFPSERTLRPPTPTLAPVQAPQAAQKSEPGAIPNRAGTAESPLAPKSGTPDASAATGTSAAGAATPPSSRTLTPELVARLFAVPAGGLLAGRPYTLADVLASARGRGEQLAVTRAYWRLSQAVGEYCAGQEAVNQLRRIAPAAGDAAALRMVRTKAGQTIRNAEIAVGRAQRALVETAQVSPSQPLPLPADLPHVGPYRTNFAEVYASQNVPSRARLLDRTLPLIRKDIDSRAKAVRAGQYAIDAAVDLYRAGTIDLAAVLACASDANEARLSLVSEVCRYNHEIAEYALAVAGTNIPSQALVTMLILQRPGEVPAISDSVPAAWTNPPLPAQVAPIAAPLGRMGPTLAPPKPVAGAENPPSGGNRMLHRDGRDRVMPPADAGLSPRGGGTDPAAARSLLPSPRIAQKALASDDSALPKAASASELALYSALGNATSGNRVKTLTLTLHWNRSLPPDLGRPVELEECLRGLSASDRQNVLDAYWLARQRAAEFQVISGQADLLDQVRPFVLSRGNRAAGALDGLRLHAARMACDADQLNAHIDLLEAEFELTRSAGQPLDGAWLLPSTTPHSGPYLLKVEAQRPEVVRQSAVRRLATAIPALAGAIEKQAAAVVEADTARATAAAAYQAGGPSVDSVLAALRGQTVETLAFLQILTGYNRSIAEYALAVLPPAIPGDQLVQTLVILR